MSDAIDAHISPFLLQLSEEIVKLRESQQSITQALKEDFNRRLSHLETRVSSCEQAASTRQCETSSSQFSEIANITAKLDKVFNDATEGTQGMEAVQEPITKASVSNLCLDAEEQAKGTRSYEVEANVYGLLVMPGRPLGSGSWLLLLLHYLVVFWLSHAIDRATNRAVDDLMGEIDGKLCMKVGDSWDCAEPLLKQMTDFTSLDRNNDGRWTMEEAGAAGLLSQFQAVHEVALESADILKVMVPPMSEVPDVFCTLGLGAFKSYAPAFGWEETAGQIYGYLWSQGIDLEAAYQTSLPDIGDCKRMIVEEYGSVKLEFGEECGEAWYCRFEDAYCMAEYMCQIDLRGIPAQSSRDLYRNYTAYYSFFPDWIYELLIKNLLQPCFLFDGDMCANAEIDSDFLRMVPRWRGLGSADRVEQCKSYVDEFCPRILGDQFRTFAKDVSESCGKRKYETETVVSDVTASRGSLLNEVNHKGLCRDNDSAIETVTSQVESAFLDQLIEMFDSAGLWIHTCEQLRDMRWCDLRFPVTRNRADGTLVNILFGSLLGEACPRTCCEDTFYEDEPMLNFTPIGCNLLCHHAGEHNDHASAIRQRCFGSGCNRISFKVEQFGQLRISAWAGKYDNEESSKITIFSNRSLQVFVINVFAGGGEDCPRDFLQVDGTKVCNENLRNNKQVFVPLKSRDSFDIFFYASLSSRCPSAGTRERSAECNWELVIVDAGERNEATISKLSFEQQIRFGAGPQGYRSFDYISFFFLILLVWVSFMWQELIRIVQLAYFLCECTDFQSRRNRTCFFFCVVLPRLAIWGWVLMVGLSLLLASSEFVEIVLNSVALGFILDVDEILYIVMVPSYVQQALLSLDPIRWKRTLSGKILGDAQIFFWAFGLLLLIAGIVTYEYYKPSGYLERAKQIDCLCDLRGAHCTSGVLH